MMSRAEVLRALRVDLAPEGFPGQFVLVLPVPGHIDPGFREFYLMSQSSAMTLYMFGVSVSSDEDAVELALSNAPEYIW